MKYDLYLDTDTPDYRDVEFYCTLTDYAHPTWRRRVTFDKAEDITEAGVWQFDDTSSATFEEFLGTPPLWVTNLFKTLTPRLEHFARTGLHMEPEAA